MKVRKVESAMFSIGVQLPGRMRTGVSPKDNFEVEYHPGEGVLIKDPKTGREVLAPLSVCQSISFAVEDKK